MGFWDEKSLSERGYWDFHRVNEIQNLFIYGNTYKVFCMLFNVLIGEFFIF